jgi:hypothetical protein
MTLSARTLLAENSWTDAAAAIVGVGLLSGEPALSRSEYIAERALLQREFPHLPWMVAKVPVPGAVIVDERAWRDPGSDLYRWDETVLTLQSQHGWLLVRPEADLEHGMQALLQVVTRYQRLAPRMNAFSCDETFARALFLHRALHDLKKPLVRADYEHALDVWQWVLRLDPDATRALQLAALFHDIERLTSEPDERMEQHATDYQAFKDAHAEVGASLAGVTARAAGIDGADCLGIQELILGHERPAGEARSEAAELLGDADALSFFSLNSRGFADYYGPEHTSRKVRYTLGRMSARALDYLSLMKLAPEVQRHILDSGKASLLVPRGMESE